MCIQQKQKKPIAIQLVAALLASLLLSAANAVVYECPDESHMTSIFERCVASRCYVHAPEPFDDQTKNEIIYPSHVGGLPDQLELDNDIRGMVFRGAYVHSPNSGTGTLVCGYQNRTARVIEFLYEIEKLPLSVEYSYQGMDCKLTEVGAASFTCTPQPPEDGSDGDII